MELTFSWKKSTNKPLNLINEVEAIRAEENKASKGPVSDKDSAILDRGVWGLSEDIAGEQRPEGSLCLPESESSRHWKQQVQGQGQTVFPHRQEARG